MDATQADILSRQIDWSSTLIFPFPSDVSNIRQATVGDAKGLLIRGGRDRHWQLYWHHGDQFFMAQGRGNLSAESFIAAAGAIR